MTSNIILRSVFEVHDTTGRYWEHKTVGLLTIQAPLQQGIHPGLGVGSVPGYLDPLDKAV